MGQAQCHRREGVRPSRREQGNDQGQGQGEVQGRGPGRVARTGLRVLVVASVLSTLTLCDAIAPGARAGTLPTCPVYSKWPVRPLSAEVRASLTKYYAVRKMTPISVDKNQMAVLNVNTERVGVHWCQNVGGGRSGYVGVVPKNAVAAVMVHVRHKAYAVTGASFTFATVIRLPAAGWRVVSDDTAP